MTKKRKPKAKEPDLIAYYFRVESFEAACSYSVRDPRSLSKREVNRDYRGQRPNETLTFGSVDLELKAILLEPRLDAVSRAEIELAAVEREPGGWNPTGIGLLYRHGDKLTTSCSLAATGLQSLLTLLSAGRRAYLCLDSEKLRYRKALIHHLYWYTEGHTELEELLLEWSASTG